MRQRDIKRRVLTALEALVESDAELLERNVGERAITGCLATYLKPLFPDHQVDVEYDRHGLDRKVLDLSSKCRGGGRRKVIPDIVIHHRGSDSANLVVIELKKETNLESRDCDRAKLRAFRRQLGYKIGVLLEVPAGPGASERKARAEWH